MRALYRIATLFALLSPALARADMTSTLDHSQPSARSLQFTETVPFTVDRAPRLGLTFASGQELFDASFLRGEGRALREGVVHVDFHAFSGVDLWRAERESRVTAASAAVTAAPEPGSLALLVTGLAGCASLWRRRRTR